MIHFLSNLSPQVITWPTAERRIEIERYFRQNGFPGAVGAIDGTHIRIDKPTNDSDSYLNRKHFYSIQAQVVCDNRRRIIAVFIGFPESVHDSRILRSSPLLDTLPEKCQGGYILGDSGYPCLRQLLTPYRDRGQLRRVELNYNIKLSQNRYIVEHCFGILKQKFRQLYHLKLRKIVDMVHFIRACCVIHNFALDDNFHVENVEINEVRLPEINEDGEDNEDRDDRDGIQMRNYVASILQQN
ncbi:uncharacterized protein CBL_08480 [Carabus blaptoides fortunei]